MSDQVERVARAIFDACYGDTHTAGWDIQDSRDRNRGVHADEELRERFRRMATAAIDAMFAMADFRHTQVAYRFREQPNGDLIGNMEWDGKIR